MTRLAAIDRHGQPFLFMGEGSVGDGYDWSRRDTLIVEAGPAPVFVRSFGVAIEPGVQPWLGALIGARPLGIKHGDLDTWSIFTAGDQAPRHARYPVPEPGLFTIAPGHRIELRFEADPFPAPTDVPAAVREALDVGPSSPELAKIDAFWKMGDPSVYDVADWTMTRFGTPSRVPVVGLHEFGRVPESDVEGNRRYDMIGCALSAWLRTGDGRCWNAASIMAWRHFQVGMRWPSGEQEYEKCSGTYCGDGGNPLYSHIWFGGIAAFARLTGDRTANRLVSAAASTIYSKAPASIWNGYGGSRFIGWSLRGLRILHGLGFRPADRDYAATVAAWTASFRAAWVKAGTPWLPNGYTPNGTKNWMDANAFAETIRTLRSAGLPDGPWVDGGRWLLDNCVDATGAAPYEILDWRGTLADSVRNDNYPSTIAAWLIPLARLLDHPKRALIEARASAGVDATQAGMVTAGSAAVKQLCEQGWGFGSVSTGLV